MTEDSPTEEVRADEVMLNDLWPDDKYPDAYYVVTHVKQINGLRLDRAPSVEISCDELVLFRGNPGDMVTIAARVTA